MYTFYFSLLPASFSCHISHYRYDLFLLNDIIDLSIESPRKLFDQLDLIPEEYKRNLK